MTVIHRLSCPKHPDHRNHRWPNQCPCVDKPDETPAAAAPDQHAGHDHQDTPEYEQLVRHLVWLENAGVTASVEIGPFTTMTIASLIRAVLETAPEINARVLGPLIDRIVDAFDACRVNGIPLSQTIREAMAAGSIVTVVNIDD